MRLSTGIAHERGGSTWARRGDFSSLLIGRCRRLMWIPVYSLFKSEPYTARDWRSGCGVRVSRGVVGVFPPPPASRPAPRHAWQRNDNCRVLTKQIPLLVIGAASLFSIATRRGVGLERRPAKIPHRGWIGLDGVLVLLLMSWQFGSSSKPAI